MPHLLRFFNLNLRLTLGAARRTQQLCFVFALAATTTLSGSASPSCPPPNPSASISTDRPSVTNASTTVPCHILQLENGFNQTTASHQHTWDLPQTTARFGLTAQTELRFTAPDYLWNTPASASAATGLSDLALGVKQQLGPFHGFDLSAMATLSLPTGARSISSHGYDTTLQLPWSRTLAAHWSAAGMFTVAWPSVNQQHLVTGQATALLDRQLTSTWDAFAEYSGTFPGAGSPQHLADFGLTWKLTPNQQLDLRGGVGLSSAAPDHFLGAGYSLRFPVHAPHPHPGKVPGP